MKAFVTLLKLSAVLALAFVAFIGCESTDSGGSASGSVYYGTGFYDPWYYGPGDYPPDVIVTPPPNRPEPPHPAHPIVLPPSPPPRPMPMPMPSIPSMPRVGAR